MNSRQDSRHYSHYQVFQPIETFWQAIFFKLNRKKHFVDNLDSFYTSQCDLQKFWAILQYDLSINILTAELTARVQKDALFSFSF